MRLDIGCTFVAVTLSLVIAGCSETGHPVAANDLESVIDAAPNLSLGEAVAELGLSGDQKRHVEALVGELHSTMMATHESIGDVENLNESERAALHESLQGQMQEMHERHGALMESLTEEQRAQFMENLHRQMKDHAGAQGGEGHDGAGHS